MQDLINYLNERGFSVPNIEVSGKVIRFDRDGNLNGWFIGHSFKSKSGKEFYYAMFGDWKTGESHEYKSYENKALSSREANDIKDKIAKNKKEYQEEKRKTQDATAIVAKKTWDRLSCENKIGQYHHKKGINRLYGAKFIDNKIIIPMHDIHSKMWGYQTINDSDSFKMFLKGQKIDSCFFSMDGLSVFDAKKIFVCEGYSTAATIYQITKEVTVCAFNANNVYKVTKQLKEVLKDDVQITICADNDKFNEINTGLSYARKSHKELGVNYVYPEFEDDTTKPTDFNDLYVLEGEDQVKKFLLGNNEKYYPNKDNGFHIGKENKNGDIVWHPCYYELVDYMLDRYKLIYNEKYSMMYNGTHYVNVSDNEIKAYIVNACKSKLKPGNIENAFKLTKARGHTYLSDVKPGLINVSNGVLDIRQKKLCKHSHKHGFKYCTDTVYNPDAKCDKWKTFLFEVLQGDMELMKLLQEMFGYVLLGGDPFLHRAFVLLGEGRNGKSTVLDVLKALIGDANYSSVPINMLHKPFSAVQLRGKLANIVGEISTSVIDSESFKTAVGGEELIMSHKNKDEFASPVSSRFIFASNRLPNFGDTTTGTYEKLCIIPFNLYIPEYKRDVTLKDRLLEELPGILNWSVDGASRVLNSGRISSPEASSEELDKWRMSMDHVHRFISECLDVTGDNNDFANSKDLYDVYIDFCKSEGCKTFGKSGFMRKLIENLKKKTSEVSHHRTKMVRGVKGISINEEIRNYNIRVNADRTNNVSDFFKKGDG